MSWICLSDNKKCKARKRHRCDVCTKPILPGEDQITRSGVQPGEGYSRMHMHMECEVVSREWTDEDWESRNPMSWQEVIDALVEQTTNALESGINAGGVR